MDASEHAKLKGKWIEDYRVLVAWVKEKITWTKSGRESAEREVDQFHMLENAARDEKKRRKGQG